MNPDTNKQRRWTDRVDLTHSLAEPLTWWAAEGSATTEQLCLDRPAFGDILEVAQTFDTSGIRYFRPAEFRQVIKRCAIHRIEILGVEVVTSSGRLVDVCFAPDKDDTLAWCLAFLERFTTQSSLLLSATYEHRRWEGVKEVKAQ